MRGPSRSSMRRMILQLFCRASSQLIRNVRALPRWSAPVGEGARRVMRTVLQGRGLGDFAQCVAAPRGAVGRGAIPGAGTAAGAGAASGGGGGGAMVASYVRLPMI